MTDNERKELLLKAKPILFNTEMVRAILDGRKKVTRRVMKNPPPDVPTAKFRTLRDGKAIFEWDCSTNLCERKPPYYPDDILYVRETFMYLSCGNCMTNAETDTHCLHAKENGGCYVYKANDYIDDPIWHPSIHMPKEAARIFLRVTNVRIESLQDITTEQIEREGIYRNKNFNNWYTCGDGNHSSVPKLCFRRLWDSTIKKSDLAKYGWTANPWVWVIEFERVD